MEEMLIWVTLATRFLCSIAIANGYYQEGVRDRKNDTWDNSICKSISTLYRDIGWDQVEVLCLLNSRGHPPFCILVSDILYVLYASYGNICILYTHK